jgi:hypothetical protein
MSLELEAALKAEKDKLLAQLNVVNNMLESYGAASTIVKQEVTPLNSDVLLYSRGQRTQTSRVKRTHWTPAMDKLLLRCVKDGNSLESIALTMNLPYAAVYSRTYGMRENGRITELQRRNTLGRPARPQTPVEARIVYKTNKNTDGIGDELLLCKNQNKPWTLADIKVVVEGRDQNLTARELAVLLDRSDGAIKQKFVTIKRYGAQALIDVYTQIDNERTRNET